MVLALSLDLTGGVASHKRLLILCPLASFATETLNEGLNFDPVNDAEALAKLSG